MRPLMPPVQTPDNLFHDGNPLTGELGTIVDAEHLNNEQAAIRDTQSELIAILTAAAMEPESTAGQLLAALNKLYAPLNDTLGALSILVGEANKLPYFTSANAASLTVLSSIGRDIIGKATVADVLTYLGLGDVLHLGDYGVGKAIQSSAAQRTHVGSFFYEPGVPGSTLYPVSVAVTESGGPTPGEWVQLAISYGADFRAFVGHQVYGGIPEISELFHDKRKPTNSDVGSYPATGGTLHGSLTAEGSVQGGPGYDVVSQQDIWAGRNIYESGKRVFSPNNHQPVIADGQTWVDVTASRQLGATYTNTTGRPIQMLLDFVRPANDWHVGVKIDNVAFSNGGGSYCPIIPAGSSYSVLSAGISQYTWRELR
ncbi:hypothetical protein [Citrobacter freundii]|uniref:hypothetical protein n=1 Tax=Citrobacter freundii TaxID=546 RepID=UPI001FFE02E9|nr:hypothetical protein [Citrobacter freundii]